MNAVLFFPDKMIPLLCHDLVVSMMLSDELCTYRQMCECSW